MDKPPVRFVDEYRQVRTNQPLLLLRDTTLPLLAWFEQASGLMDAALQRPRVQILNLHHVFADEEADFRRLLQRLSQTHAFITYSEAIERIWSGCIDRPYVAFTFDDGLKSGLRAARLLEDFGARAIFFLSLAMIDETDDWRIVRFCREQLALPPVAFMDWRDVETLLRQGHEIGSHTMNHLDLGQLDNTRLQDEISRSYELLRERTGMARHFSWPYGRFRHFSPEAARTVFDAGFASCASAVRGCHVSGTAGRDLCVRRTHVVAGWPLRNVLFWLSYYGRTASPQSNCWPETWRAVLGETEGDAEPCGS